MSTRELVEQAKVQTIALGDAAFVGLPGELFSKFGNGLLSPIPS